MSKMHTESEYLEVFMKYRLLLIEDDADTVELTSMFLEGQGFLVTASESALTAMTLLHHHVFDLVILDISLPDYNGFEVCSKIRNQSAIPIIFVSAQSDEESHTKAFRLGADDYLVKPINLEILTLHIWAILRRVSALPDIEKTEKDFIHDKKFNKIFFKGNSLHLTATEYSLLAVLIKNYGHTVSREKLSETLSSDADQRSLDYHVKNIRKKLGDMGRNPERLKTDYGLGYRLV